MAGDPAQSGPRRIDYGQLPVGGSVNVEVREGDLIISLPPQDFGRLLRRTMRSGRMWLIAGMFLLLVAPDLSQHLGGPVLWSGVGQRVPIHWRLGFWCAVILVGLLLSSRRAYGIRVNRDRLLISSLGAIHDDHWHILAPRIGSIDVRSTSASTASLVVCTIDDDEALSVLENRDPGELELVAAHVRQGLGIAGSRPAP